MTNPAPTSTVNCPECGRPATVLSRFSITGTAGVIDYLRIRCGGPLTMLVAAHEVTGGDAVGRPGGLPAAA